MAAFLDRITDRQAYVVAALGFGASLLAAFLTPQERELGAWVRLTIWHGMLKWACIAGIFGMGVLAAVYLVTRREKLYEWARAMQVALLPLWVVAVAIGVTAAKLVWGSYNLSERRMLMSVGYTMVAAVALMLSLLWEKPGIGAWGQIVTAAAMGVGLWWISTIPASEDVHPAAAVMSSDNPVFKIAAFSMMAGCLVMVLALAVPVRRWLERHAHEDGAAEAAAVPAE